MKPVLLQFALLVAVATTFAACDPASDFAHDERAVTYDGQAATQGENARANGEQVRDAGTRWSDAGASCPCFSRNPLSHDGGPSAGHVDYETDYYLFFDVFNYYGLDARRTEARALVSTPAGLLEEVAAVYITQGSGPDDLHLICHRQEVARHPVTGEPYYRYETLAPTVEEAESCRGAIVASVGDQEPCQGAACGIRYSKEQLSPDYPLYNDDLYRAPDSLLDTIQKKVAEVGRMLSLPA